MATEPHTTEPTSRPPEGAGPGVAFFGAGLALATWAMWLRANHDPAPQLVVWIALAIAAAAGLLGLARLGAGVPDATLRSVGLGTALLGAGVAGWLASMGLREYLGESVGLALFAVVVAGYALSLGRSREPGQGAAPIGPLLALAGAGLLVTFVYVVLVRKLGPDYVPESIAALLGGFAIFFSGIILLSTSDPGARRSTLTNLGSLVGVFLMLVAFGRAWYWSDTLLGGVAQLSGVDGWRFWVVAYLFLAGFGLACVSLAAGASTWAGGKSVRRATYGYFSLLGVVFVFVLFCVANLLAYLKLGHTSFNWSRTRGLSSISESTKSLLASLEKQTNVYVLMSPRHPVYSDTEHFLNNARSYSSRLAVKYVNPDAEVAEYAKLAARFKELSADARDTSRGILLTYGPLGEATDAPPPHAFVAERRLFEESQDFDKAAGRNKLTLAFKAEAEVTKELRFLLKKRERQRIYFLQGHGELDVTASDRVPFRAFPSSLLREQGFGKVFDALAKDQYEVKGLRFGLAGGDEKSKDVVTVAVEGDKKPEVPDDCSTLVIGGPGTPLPRATLDALERYLDRGGRLVAFLDVFLDATKTKTVDVGLEAILKKYGVHATQEFVLRAPSGQVDVGYGPLMRDFRAVRVAPPSKDAATTLATSFQSTLVFTWAPRVLRAVNVEKYRVAPLLVAESLAVNRDEGSVLWNETDVAAFGDFQRFATERFRSGNIMNLLPKEPLPVAVTVTEGTGASAKPRMVVFGDAEFVANTPASQLPTSLDLVVSSLDWLAERSSVGPRPKETSSYAFGKGAEPDRMTFGAFWTIAILLIALGACLWIARRR